MESNYIHEIISSIVDCKQDPKVEVWEREIVRDFGSRLQVALEEMTKDYEEHRDENPTVREYFFGVLSQIQGIPASLPRGISLGARAVDWLLKIWNIALKWIDAFIKEHKKASVIFRRRLLFSEN